MSLPLRICLLLWLTPAAFAGPGPGGEEIIEGVRLLRTDFGTWSDSDGVFHSSNVLALKSGGNFGWRFRVNTEKESLKLRVALELPAPPKTWMWNGAVVLKNVSDDGLMKISADRRTATIEKEVLVSDGWVADAWVFDEGDPYGPHTVRIYAGEKLLRVFRFRVVEPKK